MTDNIRHALARIAATWPHLDTARDAATARRRPEPRPMGRTTKASLDTLLRAERAERAGRQARLSAPSPAPANLDVVDAQHLATVTLRDLCWLSANVLRGPWRPGHGWWTMPHPWTVGRAFYALHHAAPWWPTQLARDAAHDLDQAAGELEAAVGLDRHDDEIWRAGHWWVTASGAARRLGCTRDNVYDWARRGLIVDEHDRDVSIRATGQRWYRLVDVRRAARAVGREAA